MKAAFLLIMAVQASLPMALADSSTPGGREHLPLVEGNIQIRSDHLQSPRSTLNAFLVAMQEQKADEAIKCLDLTHLSYDMREAQGQEVAAGLYKILMDVLPDIPETSVPNDPRRYEPYAITLREDQPRIELVRQYDGRWLFSTETVEAVPAILQVVQTQPAASQPADAMEVPTEFRSARAVIRTFLEAMQTTEEHGPHYADAIECLDVSTLDTIIQQDQSRLKLRADALKDVIDRSVFVIYAWLPEDPQSKPVNLREGLEGSLVVHRTPEGTWKFSAKTIEGIVELSKKLSAKPQVAGESGLPGFWLRDLMPDRLKSNAWMGLELWQWAALLLLIFLGLAADLLARRLLNLLIVKVLARRHLELNERSRRSALRPIGLLVMTLVWYRGLDPLVLPDHVDAILLGAVKILLGVTSVWSIYRVIDLVCDYLAAAATKTASKFDDLLVPMVRRSLQIGVTVAGLIFLSDAFGWNLQTLLAGLGIGGLAIGFAARESLQNIFGSLTVLMDRPFHIGDWVKLDGVEGTVEAVGFRTMKIRTFYNSLITVPNLTLLTAKIDNMGARRYRRIYAKLAITYDTPPEKIDAFCEGIRELIRKHPYTRKDYYHVYFNEFADTALNVLLYCFHEVPDWGTELRERHRLFNDILRLAKRLGIEFAFPTQTIHLYQENEPPPGSRIPAPENATDFGRSEARSVVRETGLEGTMPPPVDIVADGFDDAGDGDG